MSLARLKLWLPQSSRVRQLLADSGWQFGETGMRMLLGLVVGAIVARHLSTEGFGVISYVWAIVSFVVPFVRLGLDSVLVREVSMHPENTQAVVGAALRITLVSCLLGMCCILSYALLRSGDRSLALALTFGSLSVLSAPFGIYQGLLKANFYAGLVARYRILCAIAFAMLRLGMVFAGAQVMVFVGLAALEELTINAICYFLCRKYSLLKHDRDEGSYWRPWLRPLLSEGIPLMVSFVIIGVYTRLDILMLERMRSIHETGVYGAASKLSEIWHCIPGILVGTFLPHFAKLRHEDAERFLRGMKRFAAVFFWLSLLIVAAVWFSSTLLIDLLFGADFLEAAPALRAHVLSFPAVCLGGLVAYWNIIEKEKYYLLIASSVGLVFNFVLNLVLIPRHGVVGASVATCVSYSMSIVVPALFIPKSRAISRAVLDGILLRI